MGILSWVLITTAMSGLSSNQFEKYTESYKEHFTISEPSFKQVNSFSRPVVFLNISFSSKDPNTTFAQLYFLNNKQENKSPGPIINFQSAKSVFDGEIIGVRPDGNSFFVSVSDKLMEFDSHLKLERNIPIQEFKFEPNDNKFEYEGFGEASDNTLWFGVRKIWKEGDSELYKILLTEWDFNKPPVTRLTANAEPMDGITVDAANRKIFTYGSIKNEIYDFKATENNKVPYRGFNFIDFEPNYGLLLSKTEIHYPGEQTLIVKFDMATGKKTVIAEGLSAVWGFNGYVYYCDTRKRLWRCSADGNDSMRFSSGILKSPTTIKIIPPKVSNDRTMLAYNYTYANFPESEIIGTALIDLKTHEYIVLKDQSYEYNRMAWLIKDSEMNK
jgi:hypothetical protein